LGRSTDINFASREFIGCCGDKAFLQYYARHCTHKGKLNLPENGKYDVDVIDTWEMTRERILTGVSGKVEVTLPGKEGMAVLAVKNPI
jgi:hypothetical protein